MTSTTTDRPATSTPTSTYAVFSSLVGLAALVVLAQGLWAGLFLEHDGQRDAASSWIDVHARGADLAILLAVLATVWAVWKLRRARTSRSGAWCSRCCWCSSPTSAARSGTPARTP